MNKKLRILAFTVLVTIICVFAIKHYLHIIIAPVIEAGLKQFKVVDPLINISRIGIREAEIPELVLKRFLGSDEVTIKASKVILGYNLLQHTLTRLEFGTVKVEYLPGLKTDANSSPEFFEIPNLQQLLKLIPIEVISIEKGLFVFQDLKVILSGKLDRNTALLNSQFSTLGLEGSLSFDFNENMLSCISTYQKHSTIELKSKLPSKIGSNIATSLTVQSPVPSGEFSELISDSLFNGNSTVKIPHPIPLNPQALLDSVIANGSYTLSSRDSLKPLLIDGTLATQSGKTNTTFTGEIYNTVFNGNASYAFKEKSFSGKITVPEVELSKFESEIADKLTSWPSELTLSKGKASANTTFDYNNGKLNSSLSLSLDGADGSFRETNFSGLSTDISFPSLPDLNTETKSRVKVESIDTGIKLEDINMFLRLRRKKKSKLPLVELSDLSAKAFDGTLSSDLITIGPEGQESEFTLKMSGLALESILETQRQEELSGSGTLSGALPVRVSKTGLQVSNGKLRSHPPGGDISYAASQRARQIADSTPGLDIALQALENFKYRSLDVGVDYLPDGDLSLALQIQGNNPDFNKGQAINFNINVEENIPALLKSLRIAGDVSEELGQKALGR